MAIVTTVATPPLFHVMYVKGVLAERATKAAMLRAESQAAGRDLDLAADGSMQHEDSFVMDVEHMAFSSAFKEAHRLARDIDAEESVISIARRHSSHVDRPPMEAQLAYGLDIDEITTSEPMTVDLSVASSHQHDVPLVVDGDHADDVSKAKSV